MGARALMHESAAALPAAAAGDARTARAPQCRRCAALGVKIVMDDFGTGPSPAGEVRSFPVEKIKGHRGFLNDLPHRCESLAVVRAVAGSGLSLGMTTVVEGVQTQAQPEGGSAEGFDEGQGYLGSGPVPAAPVQALLHRLARAAWGRARHGTGDAEMTARGDTSLSGSRAVPRPCRQTRQARVGRAPWRPQHAPNTPPTRPQRAPNAPPTRPQRASQMHRAIPSVIRGAARRPRPFTKACPRPDARREFPLSSKGPLSHVISPSSARLYSRRLESRSPDRQSSRLQRQRLRTQLRRGARTLRPVGLLRGGSRLRVRAARAAAAIFW
ncbi:EAL domain-containing protein [Pandoraea sputorum]|uniref:EAL domain-containing protein n=1 Tax=Pandoraea sputorum TaxID=93222 RepID=UPI0037C82C06